MYQVLKKNWNKTNHLILSGLVIIILVLVTVVYKGDEKNTNKSELIENTIIAAERIN